MLKYLNFVYFYVLLYVILCELLYFQNRFIYFYLYNIYIQYKLFNVIFLVFVNFINKFCNKNLCNLNFLMNY